jgi:hypothetical protein
MREVPFWNARNVAVEFPPWELTETFTMLICGKDLRREMCKTPMLFSLFH